MYTDIINSPVQGLQKMAHEVTIVLDSSELAVKGLSVFYLLN